MSSAESPPRRHWPRLLFLVVGVIALGFVLLLSWMELEKRVFRERILLFTAEKTLRVGMTRDEVEKHFGVDPGAPIGNPMNLTPHEEVKADIELVDGMGNKYVRYTAWYRGLAITSQRHVEVTYDPSGTLKEWKRN